MPFDLTKVIRPNILALKPYRCARDDYSEGILLDANENAYGPALTTEHKGDLNRYPDPYQVQVKERIMKLRGLKSTKNLFLGVGSDEVIDLLIRIACVPAKDKILITPPTYGMYSVCAQINDVEVVKSKLIVENGAYQLDVDNVRKINVCYTVVCANIFQNRFFLVLKQIQKSNSSFYVHLVTLLVLVSLTPVFALF